ncbi:MAG: hypothetical protein ACM34L_11450 [Gemmatimonas sp.]|nr:hypothetical protein [Gemmatimonadaceae bacterium]
MPTPPQPMHAGFGAQAAAQAPQQPRTSADTSMPSRPQTVTPPSERPVVPARTQDTPPRAPAIPATMAAMAAATQPAPASAHSPSPSPAPPAARPSAPPSRPGASQPGAPASRPPINPFLANDPNQKAKRLARALVSDIIAYFPDRHAQGKREGTLRESFREEIKKSYEEYVEQMGKEFAENTTHFQDALNDVLAGGAKIF